MMKKRAITILSILALILSVAWFIAQPDYEPAITFVLGIVGLISTHWMNPVENGSIAQLTDKAKKILVAAAKTNGNIAVFNMPQKKFVDAGVQSDDCTHFEGNERESAEYVDAVSELTERGLTKYESGSLWRVTTAGYSVADKMK
jgi:CRISPR/Cas system-associated protein Cas7 (RAMP superfamily)